ncbi:HAMP domain-containing histidine kinase [Chitinophaga polysaccharea]|uniref:sensor histidine kinase n=1 Tax=Chitinophaga TaxID=79328 RepID=UPI00145523DE|nr:MULTISPECIES: HAMP domain-containing sensor histidine kinase [Chitinophaga]NLR61340.1 HAMP domain-containing histidine kinase [Chitinophaga polysaccharea]NLU95176.1 HAMP domain-containing histidine kinase [Chitinophaga sp. Ak27]
MFKQFIGWKFVLTSVAVLIIGTTIWFVSNLSKNIQDEERKKVATWVEANRELLRTETDANLNLAIDIVTNNTTIPLILTDEEGKILDSRNFDSLRIVQDPNFLPQELKAFKKQHPPFIMEVDAKQKLYNYIYYGDSLILRQIRYYPYIQLIVVTLFIGIVLFALSSTNRATQNQVWVGLAKETAHQLGTPLSSMEAWLEILRENEANTTIVAELSKDVDRLKLITDRFSKIGSVPKLEETNIVTQIENMTNYIRKRAPQKVQLQVHSMEEELPAMISPPLFDWVVENLLKNALDAMEGKGKIDIFIENHSTFITIDVADTGKGISKMNFEKVFKPGFSTKRRGWGLGLSLAKRIIEEYHQGRLYVKSSELNKGTTFRIVLRK